MNNNNQDNTGNSNKPEKKKNYDESKKKIKEIYKRGASHSEDASKIARQFALGEGALLWFLLEKNHHLESLTTYGLIFLIAYFTLDLGQYLLGTWTYKNLGKTYEWLNNKDNPIDPDKISPLTELNTPIYLIFTLKFIMLTITSLLLFTAILKYTP